MDIGGADSNTAMMARLGAGKKNKDGSFSGILMGDWNELAEDGSWKKVNTGLYGYSKNAVSYGFKEDGTAFIGKPGAGRINFNGDGGIIFSSNFNGEIYNV
jgi:hypothetical protein